jgi:hypothetical protein
VKFSTKSAKQTHAGEINVANPNANWSSKKTASSEHAKKEIVPARPEPKNTIGILASMRDAAIFNLVYSSVLASASIDKDKTIPQKRTAPEASRGRIKMFMAHAANKAIAAPSTPVIPLKEKKYMEEAGIENKNNLKINFSLPTAIAFVISRTHYVNLKSMPLAHN